MPKVVPPEALNQIAELIGRHPDGIGLDGLLQAVGPGTPRRTLQRRLAALAKQERIVTEGGARALKYRLAAIRGNANVVI